jgi:hypothetical protein
MPTSPLISKNQLDVEHQKQAESVLFRFDATYEQVAVPPLFEAEEEDATDVEQARLDRIETFKTTSAEELLLLHADVTRVVPLEDGVNDTSILHFADGKSGIFKPASGEQFTTAKIEPGTYYLRERAAYLVSNRLNFEVVPTTVIREINGEVGILQDFRSGAKMGSEVDLGELDEQLYKLWVFDYLVWNPDRDNPRNFLVEEDGTIDAIDHGLTFGSHFNPYKAFPGVPVPESLTQFLESFAIDPDRQEAMLEELMELLPQDQAMACLRRILHATQKLSQNGALSEVDLEYNPRVY